MRNELFAKYVLFICVSVIGLYDYDTVIINIIALIIAIILLINIVVTTDKIDRENETK